MTEQPEALRLADVLDATPSSWDGFALAAAELRRLHAENEELHRAVSMTGSLNRKLMEEIERSTAQHLTDTTRVVELEAEVESLRATNAQMLEALKLAEFAMDDCPMVSHQLIRAINASRAAINAAMRGDA